MQEQELFDCILDKDEVIQKVYKPLKARVFLSSIVFVMLMLMFLLGITAIVMFLPDSETDSPALVQNGLYFLIPVAIALLIFAVIMAFVSMHYKKTFFCYTNKRLIVRTGIIGVDYKSLDMSFIGALTVKVNLFDKLLRKNTGSLFFGSIANPMGGENNSPFSFGALVNPYEVYKEIKEVIDEVKSKAPIKMG